MTFVSIVTKRTVKYGMNRRIAIDHDSRACERWWVSLERHSST